jgi:hypothetical protein
MSDERRVLVVKEGYYIPDYVIKIYRYQYGLYALGFLVVLIGVFLHRKWIGISIFLAYLANAIVLIGISIMLFTYAIVYKVDKAIERGFEEEEE